MKITKVENLNKVAAFIRANSKGAFDLSVEVASELFRFLDEYCRTNNIKITITNPEGARIATFTAAGATVGAVAGGMVAGLLGFVTGAVIGAGVGFVVAHTVITWDASEGRLVIN